MTIFKNNIKRILRKKSNIIFMFVLPIITMVISFKMISFSSPPSVGIIVQDNTELTNFIIDSLEKNCTVEFIEESNINDNLIDGTIDFAIKIPMGYTEDIINNKNPKVNTFIIKETEDTAPLIAILNYDINAIKNIARAAEGDHEKFYNGLELYNNGKLDVDYKYIEGTDRKQEKILLGFGFIIMFMMYLSNNAARLMMEDKRYKTYSRMFCSPITSKSYMFQNILSFIIIIGIQIIAALMVAIKVINIDLGSSTLGIFLLLMIFGICSIAMAVAINVLSKDMGQSNVISQFIIVPMSMLGGCFWPRDIMPKFLQQLSKFIPVTWALEGIEEILIQPKIETIFIEIIILILFSLAFFLIGLSRKNSMEF